MCVANNSFRTVFPKKKPRQIPIVFVTKKIIKNQDEKENEMNKQNKKLRKKIIICNDN